MTDGIPDDETGSREDAQQRPVERLVIRLRAAANNKSLDIGTAWNLLDEAADAIEALVILTAGTGGVRGCLKRI